MSGGGSISFDEIESREGFLATGEKPAEIDWLPDPPRQPRHVTLISVDDHLVEPPDMFEGRLPAKYADAAPRVMTEDDGATEYWLYDGQQHYKVGLNAVVGKPLHQRTFDPARFDEMRRARVRHRRARARHGSQRCLRIAVLSVVACRFRRAALPTRRERPRARARGGARWPTTGSSRCGPAHTPGASSRCSCRGSSTRRKVRPRSAPTPRRGFHAVTFPELPERLGLPSLHTGHWDPFLAVCAETETVVCLHVGSSSSAPATSTGAPSDTIGVLFFGWAMFAAVDWLYSKVALRFPDLKLCLSEGGIGWVAGLLDRLDHVGRYQAIFGTWEGVELTPREVMERNFWFCTIDDIAGLEQRHRIGVDHLLLESDYPHQDGTWPDTQEIVWSQIGGFPRDEIERLAWRNASELFHHPVPDALRARPRRRPADRAMTYESMYERHRLYIGGAWVAPVDDGRIDVVNPATEEVIGHAPPRLGRRCRPGGGRGARRVRARAVAAHRAGDARRCARRDGRAPAGSRPTAGRAQHRRGRRPDHVRTRARTGTGGGVRLLRAAHPRVPVARGATRRAGTCARRARTGRGDRRSGAVQRADHVGRGQARPRTGLGVPHRVQARARDPARRVRARGGSRGGGRPARGRQHRAGRRRRGRGPGGARRRRPGGLHRQHHGRARHFRPRAPAPSSA